MTGKAGRTRVVPYQFRRGSVTPLTIAGAAIMKDCAESIFADRNYVYVFNNKFFIRDTDIQAIFGRLGIEEASQAFYLGRELEKALLAVRLGKKYSQEDELRWGYLTP